MTIKVLLADDSASSRQMLTYLIGGTPDLRVIGQAMNGMDAIEMVGKLRPDVVVMDVDMPRMNGFDATREIMRTHPMPIVLLSANSRDTKIAFEAMNAGAVAVVKKPGMTQSLTYHDSVREFTNLLRAMSGVRVIRHIQAGNLPPAVPSQPDLEKSIYDRGQRPEIICIVSSTGGPKVLGEIIKDLPSTFKLPVVIVQHITPDFVTPLVSWLDTLSRLPIRVAQSGEQLRPGIIYFAPGNRHLCLSRDCGFELRDTPMNVPHIPSGDVLLQSAAEQYGSQAIGIVLTGMGKDGAAGLRAMYDAGAMTIAQDETSSVVFGMPQEAIALGAVRKILNVSEITNLLMQYDTMS